MSALRIAGVEPGEVTTPASRDELVATVRALATAGRTFAFTGGGTQLGLGNAPRSLDTVVRTAALDRVIDYAPEDQTITVEAGLTFAELDRVLAANGQMLPLDVPDRVHGTVGGAIATNASGPRRLRYGTIKDLIVGIELVRPDGTRAHGGGKVVKNVAGFDLPKLMTGSLGTLGAIASATFRLYPVPERRVAVRVELDATRNANALARALIAGRLEPESFAVYDGHTAVVVFAGTVRGVDEQVARLDGGHVLSELEIEAFEQREAAVRRDGAWRFRASAPPAADLTALARVLATAPVAVPVAYPLSGIALHACAEAPDVDAARAACPGSLTVTAMPDEARARVDAWGPPPPSFALMTAVKRNFDPHALCNPGRFVGGL